jgi:serine/threonine-protein kinase
MEPAENELPDDPLISTLIGGRYRVLRQLGEGGAGIVYDAMHEELGRPVAIKVLGAAWAYDQAAVQRFQREARAASNLGHRHIVDVYDLGKLDDGRPYLVMERLHGEPLDAALERGEALPAERIAEVVAQAASALDAVHKKGIVHRDIKPENLFLARTDDDGEPEVKLLDFGLVAIASPDGPASRLTRQGTVHGTPHYMAPEATGDELPDHRADIYSLGVVTYELLTGKVPFDSPNPLRILTLKHERDAPSLTEATGQVYSESLEEVFRRVLSRNPEMRYESAGEFAQALQGAVRGAPVVASVQPPGTMVEDTDHEPREHARSRITAVTSLPPMRRGPIVLVAIGAVVAIGAAVALVSASGADEEPVASALDDAPAAEPTQAAPVEESGLPSESGEALDEPTTATAGDAEGSSGDGETTREPAGPSEASERTPRAARDRAAPPPREPETGGTGARVVNFRGRVEPAETGGEGSQESPALAETHRERAVALTREGTTTMLQGRLPEAIRMFRDATMANPRYAPAWRQLGLANERLGRGPEAARAYERYLALAPTAQDADVVRRRLESLR